MGWKAGQTKVMHFGVNCVTGHVHHGTGNLGDVSQHN